MPKAIFVVIIFVTMTRKRIGDFWKPNFLCSKNSKWIKSERAVRSGFDVSLHFPSSRELLKRSRWSFEVLLREIKMLNGSWRAVGKTISMLWWIEAFFRVPSRFYDFCFFVSSGHNFKFEDGQWRWWADEWMCSKDFAFDLTDADHD
jgi:hypothetical protein